MPETVDRERRHIYGEKLSRRFHFKKKKGGNDFLGLSDGNGQYIIGAKWKVSENAYLALSWISDWKIDHQLKFYLKFMNSKIPLHTHTYT